MPRSPTIERCGFLGNFFTGDVLDESESSTCADGIVLHVRKLKAATAYDTIWHRGKRSLHGSGAQPGGARSPPAARPGAGRRRQPAEPPASVAALAGLGGRRRTSVLCGAVRGSALRRDLGGASRPLWKTPRLGGSGCRWNDVDNGAGGSSWWRDRSGGRPSLAWPTSDRWRAGERTSELRRLGGDRVVVRARRPSGRNPTTSTGVCAKGAIEGLVPGTGDAPVRPRRQQGALAEPRHRAKVLGAVGKAFGMIEGSWFVRRRPPRSHRRGDLRLYRRRTRCAGWG